MKIKAKHLLLSCLISVGLLIGVFSHLPDGKLHLVFCDVGQGDAIYIKTPKGSDILIDAGPNEKVLSCLSKHMPFYDRQIELVILTHPHADHLTGLNFILDRFKVDKILMENIYVDNQVFKSFMEKVISQNIDIYNPKAGDKIVVDQVELIALWPREVIGDKNLWKKDQLLAEERGEENCQKVLGASTIKSDLNKLSLVFLIKYNGFSALLTGDADNNILSNIVELKEEDSKIEVLKVPHHGSKTSLSTALLDQLKPKTAVISVGKNSFGHPAEEILKILSERDIKTKRTDRDGEIEITN